MIHATLGYRQAARVNKGKLRSVTLPGNLGFDSRGAHSLPVDYGCRKPLGGVGTLHGLSFVPVASQDGGDLISRQGHKPEPKTRAGVDAYGIIETPPTLTGGEGYPALGASSPTRRKHHAQEVAVNALDGSGDARGAWDIFKGAA